MPRLGLIAVELAAVACATFAAIAYLKLGYFLVVVLPLSVWVALRTTRRHREGFPPGRSAFVTAVAFCLVTALVWSTAIQHGEETRELTWEAVQTPGSNSPEVRFNLGGGHSLGSRSAELADYLQTQSRPTVTVHLPITRTLGCFQSVGPPSVEGFGVAPLGSYMVVGSGAGPWEEHWWCP